MRQRPAPPTQATNLAPIQAHPKMADQPTNSGIVTDSAGERHIPESTRADGSVRKAIKIRPGYRPPEDVQVYKNRTAETFRNRYKGGVLGAESVSTDDTPSSSTTSAAANKNAKRREARKKAKAAGGESNGNEADEGEEKWKAAAAKLATEPPAPSFEKKSKDEGATAPAAASSEQDPDVERKKKARNLTKKLKQARELKSKKDDGQSLLPEQFAKVIKINELVRELAALGFDHEGEPIEDGKDEAKAPTEAPA